MPIFLPLPIKNSGKWSQNWQCEIVRIDAAIQRVRAQPWGKFPELSAQLHIEEPLNLLHHIVIRPLLVIFRTRTHQPFTDVESMCLGLSERKEQQVLLPTCHICLQFLTIQQQVMVSRPKRILFSDRLGILCVRQLVKARKLRVGREDAVEGGISVLTEPYIVE